MHAHSTTDPVTASVTTPYQFAEYQSPCGRVLVVLRALAEPGETIQITNRDLAAAAQCSAGSIPTILRTLERDGWIERVTSTQGSLVLLVDQSLDRAARAEPRSNADRIPTRSNADRQELVDSALPCDLTPPEPIETWITESGDPEIDPPHTPHKEFNHDSMQQQHARIREPKISEQEADPRVALLLQFQVVPPSIAEILRERPNIQADEITAKGRNSQTRRDINPPRLLTRCLLYNEPLYSQEELDARQATNAAAAGGVAAHQRKRPAGAEGRHARVDTDYNALLAQIRAANPGM